MGDVMMKFSQILLSILKMIGLLKEHDIFNNIKYFWRMKRVELRSPSSSKYFNYQYHPVRIIFLIKDM